MVKNKVLKLKASIKPLCLEGGDEPLKQVVDKLNEVIEELNKV